MTDTPWGSANADISAAGGFKNMNIDTWINSLNAISNNLDIIKKEQLLSKGRAMMKMRRLRWKKSFLDQKLKIILKPAWKDKKLLNIGIGDGDFPCNGRGELSVPTTDLARSLKRIIKMLNIQQYVKIVNIDEYNTTKCCHRCGTIMNKLTTSHGKECLRYRVCTQCTHNQTLCKRRNRDVNASKNILKILECKVNDLPRPEYLHNPWNAIE